MYIIKYLRCDECGEMNIKPYSTYHEVTVNDKHKFNICSDACLVSKLVDYIHPQGLADNSIKFERKKNI